MSRCQDCGADHAPQVVGQPCACCAGDTASVEACPSCAAVPADRATGYAVTVWVEGAATQEDADRVVERMLAASTAPPGTTVSVVPE